MNFSSPINRGIVSSWFLPMAVIAPAVIRSAAITSVVSFAAAVCNSQEAGASKKEVGTREGNRWTVPVNRDGATRIPRAYASLRGAHFQDFPSRPVEVKPGIKEWELTFQGAAPNRNIVLEFDSFPTLLGETKPARQAGDGTVTLPCSQGQTIGSKLRFEPQPHKNTIGYWADSSDRVKWPIEISKPGTFNVGLLQAAGSNGGGRARISLIQNGKVIDSLDYRVLVTGHFQNFVWKHAGSLTAKSGGSYLLQIEALHIEKAALMDVRHVHLSPRRPNSK